MPEPESRREAVISIGTNSCRLLIATRAGDRPPLPEYHETRGTRIGEGVAEHRRLDHDAVERTLAAVRDYAQLARGSTLFGIGTSALRDAKDAEPFLKRFENDAGVPLAILSGDDEARYSFEGALCGLRAAGRTVADAVTVIDVGGGSTELAVRARAEGPVAVTSLQLGAVRLTETHLASDPPSAAEIEACRLAIRVMLRELPANATPRGMLVAVGGTANAAARMLQLMEERSGVAEIAAQDLADLLKATISIPVSERKRMRGLPAQRADIFPAGLMIVDEVVRLADAATLVVSASDLLLGYIACHG